MRQITEPETSVSGGAVLSVETAAAEVDRLFAEQRWTEAAALLDAHSCASVPLRLKRNLARNLAALQINRPKVYTPLAGTPSSGRYQPLATGSGALTIVERQSNGQSTALGSTADPIGEAASAVSQLDRQWGPMSALVLAGVGDGHLLAHLGGNARNTSEGAERPVVVIEPDLELLTHVLLIHDLSGADGPITQPRFSWFVGPDWHQDLQSTLLEDPWMAAPGLVVSQGQRSAVIAQEIRVVQSAFEAHSRRLDEENRRYYDGLSDDALIDLLSDRPMREPRVLLPASRFTTVLQYAYRDAAKAFRSLGWDVVLIQEPAAHHRLSASTIRHSIATIKPDLVVLIDHLRYEYAELFPAKLPIATWTQDHLTTLTCEQAGRSIGRRDFVWTALSPMYTKLYGYPRQQCVPVAKLVHVPARAAHHAGVGRDVMYVSHASDEPQRLVDEIMHFSKRSDTARVLLPRCARAILRRYEEGGCFSTIAEVGEVVDHAARDLQLPLAPSERYTTLNLLFYKLNNVLYRQQALAWAIDAAEMHGLRLVIYGHGWERHSRFAPYAAGPIENGSVLEAATRDACIALQIVPYYCLHQRLLEGLVAGGFFLIRCHPSDQLLPALSAFVRRYLPDNVMNVPEARSALDGTVLTEFDRLLTRCETIADLGTRVDLVEWIRVCQAAGLFTEEDQALPRLDAVSFGSRDELGERFARFVDSPELRREIVEEQQRSVVTRLSYRAGIKRALASMRGIIAVESPSGTA